MGRIRKMTEAEVISGLKERGISADLRISEEYKDPVRTPGVVGISQTKTGFMVYMVNDHGALYNTSVHPDRDIANGRVFERAVAAAEEKRMQDHRIRTIPNDQVQEVSNPVYTGWTSPNMYQQDNSGYLGRRDTNRVEQMSYRQYGEYVPSDRGEYKPLDRECKPLQTDQTAQGLCWPDRGEYKPLNRGYRPMYMEQTAQDMREPDSSEQESDKSEHISEEKTGRKVYVLDSGLPFMELFPFDPEMGPTSEEDIKKWNEWEKDVVWEQVNSVLNGRSAIDPEEYGQILEKLEPYKPYMMDETLSKLDMKNVGTFWSYMKDPAVLRRDARDGDIGIDLISMMESEYLEYDVPLDKYRSRVQQMADEEMEAFEKAVNSIPVDDIQIEQ